MVELQSAWGTLKAPAYETDGVRPGVLTMNIGQGHELFGRYAESTGANPFSLLPAETEPVSGSPLFSVNLTSLRSTDRSLGSAPTDEGKAFRSQFGILYRMSLAHTDGSKVQHGRKIALTIGLSGLRARTGERENGSWHVGFPSHAPSPGRI